MAFDRFYFWDGRAGSLEEQALEPVVNPVEMNTTWPRVLEKLNSDTTYRDQFKAAFNVDVIDSTDVAKAIAQFERTMISANSNYDKYRIGQYTMTPLEEEGWELFKSDSGGDCFHCHQVGIGTFAGFEMINNGLQDPLVDLGAGKVSGNPLDDGKFKAPTLRNIELTSPYMHDGRFKTLEEVIDFYDSGVNVNSPNVSPFMSNIHPPGGSLNLTQHEKDALVAFLKTLTDQEFVSNPDFLP
jgi:cytochrome c peroxidase